MEYYLIYLRVQALERGSYKNLFSRVLAFLVCGVVAVTLARIAIMGCRIYGLLSGIPFHSDRAKWLDHEGSVCMTLYVAFKTMAASAYLLTFLDLRKLHKDMMGTSWELQADTARKSVLVQFLALLASVLFCFFWNSTAGMPRVVRRALESLSRDAELLVFSGLGFPNSPRTQGANMYISRYIKGRYTPVPKANNDEYLLFCTP